MTLQGTWIEVEDPDPGRAYVYVHVLFFFIGIGVTILLMNILIGVLSSNFDLYSDQAPSLFNRARAKMLLEIHSRPYSRLLSWAETRVQETGRGQALQALIRCGHGVHHGFQLLLLCVSLPFLTGLLICCRWSGLYQTFVKVAGFDDEACSGYICVLRREESSATELRSMHAVVKGQASNVQRDLQDLEDKMMRRLDRLERSLQTLTENISGPQKSSMNVEKR